MIHFRFKSLLAFSIFLGIGLAAVLVPTTAVGQRYYYRHQRSSDFQVGVMGGPSMRSFSLTSSVEALNNLKVVEEGWHLGLTGGTRSVTGNLSLGRLMASSTVGQSIDLNSLTGTLHLYPLQSKYFRPYLAVGIGSNTVRFQGTYLPAPDKGESEEDKCCCNSGGMPPDPDLGGGLGAGPAEGPAPGPGRGDIKVVQAIGGAGFEIGFAKDGRFFKLFGEGQYGLPLSAKTSSTVLKDTQFSGQFNINFGIAFGLHR